MASFVGTTVQVTLKQPANTHVQGRVVDVVAGQTLSLQDVFFPSTGARWPQWTVQATAIADLQVIDSKRAPAPTSVPAPAPAPAAVSAAPGLSQPGPVPQMIHPAPSFQQTAPSLPPPSAPQLQQQPPPFVDPAILSYNRSPAAPAAATRPSAPAPAAPATSVEVPATPVKSMLAKAAESLPVNTSPFVAEPSHVSGSRKAGRATAAVPSSPQPRRGAQLSGGLGIQDGAEDGKEQSETGTKKKVRKGQPQQKKKAASPPPVMNVEVSRNGNDMNGTAKRGKGWRQTPLLQPSPQNTSPVRKVPAKQTRRQREKEQEVQQNGWATEDATDVQDMGDFDFEASNKRFDKKGVFDLLKQDDQTADEERLVGHNKVARPGTHGGKNLHPTENVLSPKLAGAKHNGNEAASASDADTELNLANGRSSSRHSVTRSTLGKKQPSRQNSAQIADGKQPHPLAASMSSDRGGLSWPATSRGSRTGRTVPSVAASSPRPDRGPSSRSVSIARKARPLSPESAQEPRLVIQQTVSTCPVLHPTALETLETETVSRYGLTHDAITESAARCVAHLAMTMFDPFAGSRRGSRANAGRSSITSNVALDRSQPPVIVVLAGNHAVGARAVAAARHLVTRKCKIIVAEGLYESIETRDEQMKSQTAILKRMQRAGANIKRGTWRKASNYIKSLTGPPAAIIDALLAGSTYDSLLEPNARHAAESQQETREMIDWANRSRAPVLSIGCPSGVSGVDGSATLVEGEPLAVRPDKILCLGAPMPGLLEAMKGGERWDVSLADIGLNIALRSDEAVAFGAQWVAELKYVEDEPEIEPVAQVA